MNGTVNRQNVRAYSPNKQNPMNVFKKHISREKLSVWMGLSGSGHIIGPFFHEGNWNGNAYMYMLNEEIMSWFFELFWCRVEHLWWMQDGAPCHRTNVIRNRLGEVFGNRITGLGHAVEWPPRSPDLTQCDLFLWGYLKNKVYETPPIDPQDLSDRIGRHVAELSDHPEMIRNSMPGIIKRCQKCLEHDWRFWLWLLFCCYEGHWL